MLLYQKPNVMFKYKEDLVQSLSATLSAEASFVFLIKEEKRAGST